MDRFQSNFYIQQNKYKFTLTWDEFKKRIKQIQIERCYSTKTATYNTVMNELIFETLKNEKYNT